MKKRLYLILAACVFEALFFNTHFLCAKPRNQNGSISRLPFQAKIVPRSLVTGEQILELYQIVYQKLNSSDTNDEQFVSSLNKILSGYKLPELNHSSKNLVIYSRGTIGFASSSPEGLEIRDGEWRLCLPCTFGRNNLVVGYIPYKLHERNLEGRYADFLTCFEGLQELPLDRVNGRVNLNNWPQKRLVPIAIEKNSGKGALIVTDDSIASFSFETPKSGYGFANFDLT